MGPVGGGVEGAGALWEAIVAEVSQRPRLRALLSRLRPQGLSGPLLVLTGPESHVAMAKDHAAEIAELAGRIRGSRVRVEVRAAREPSAMGRADGGRTEGDQAEGREGSAWGGPGILGSDGTIGDGPGGDGAGGVGAPGEDDPATHPLVQQAGAILGLRVTRVERRVGPEGA